MPDREKVIKAWECCNPFNRKCKECPYEKDCYHDGISRHMVADAIVLLKEQEAVEPNVIRMNEFGYPVHACGKCGDLITEAMNYCPNCGAKIADRW